MDPVSLAGAVVSLIAPRLAKAGVGVAQEAGAAALEKVDAIVDAVRAKLSIDPKRAETLDRLEGESGEAEQERLRDVLVSEIALDDDFAQRLATLVKEAGDVPDSFNVQIGGSNSGNVLDIGSGSTIGNITGGGAAPLPTPAPNPPT